MPVARNGDVRIHYAVDGEGPHGTAVFVGDAGYGAWQWAWQAPGLAGPVETLVTDVRGAGRSDAPQGPYSVADVAADVHSVLDAHGASGVHVVGFGLGGMAALELALTSSRVRGLALVGTAAHGDGLPLDAAYAPPDDADGLHSSLSAALSPAFLDAHPDAIERILSWRTEEDATPDAFAAQRAAVEAFDVRDRLHEVTVPALVVHGGDDRVWPPERAAALAEGLPRGSHVELDGAGHLVGVERSRVVTDRLWDLLVGDD
jgi:pimeloyl-ACP methyl ester carboxylesterase